jgi:hypothetical protein
VFALDPVRDAAGDWSVAEQRRAAAAGLHNTCTTSVPGAVARLGQPAERRRCVFIPGYADPAHPTATLEAASARLPVPVRVLAADAKGAWALVDAGGADARDRLMYQLLPGGLPNEATGLYLCVRIAHGPGKLSAIDALTSTITLHTPGWAGATLTQRRGKLQLLTAAMPTKVQEDYDVLASADTAYAAQEAAEQATGGRHVLATAEGGGGSLIVVIEAGDSDAVRALDNKYAVVITNVQRMQPTPEAQAALNGLVTAFDAATTTRLGERLGGPQAEAYTTKVVTKVTTTGRGAYAVLRIAMPSEQHMLAAPSLALKGGKPFRAQGLHAGLGFDRFPMAPPTRTKSSRAWTFASWWTASGAGCARRCRAAAGCW